MQISNAPLTVYREMDVYNILEMLDNSLGLGCRVFIWVQCKRYEVSILAEHLAENK